MLPLLDGESRFSSQTLDRFCSVSDWMYFMGNVTVLTILLCKLYRTHKVVQFRRGQKVLARHVFGPFILSIFVATGIMIASEILHPHDHLILYYGDDPNEIVTFAHCPACPDFHQLSIYVYLIWIKIFFFWLLQIAVLVFAWKLRTVNEELGDSRRILWLIFLNTTIYSITYAANYSICYGFEELDLMKGSSIMVVVWRLYSISYVLLSVGILVFPRMYYVYYEKTHGTLPEYVQMYGTGRVRISLPIQTTTETQKKSGAGKNISIKTTKSSSPILPDDDVIDAAPIVDSLLEENNDA